MLSGAVSWNVLEDQLTHIRTSSRQNIFDSALSHQTALESNIHTSLPNPHLLHRRDTPPCSPGSLSIEDKVWISSGVEPSAPLLVSPEEGSAPESFRQRMGHHSWWRNSKKAREGSQVHWDTVDALRAVLDLSTHLHNYPIPLDTSLARFVVARDDLYIPRQHVTPVQDTWPGVYMMVAGARRRLEAYFVPQGAR